MDGYKKTVFNNNLTRDITRMETFQHILGQKRSVEEFLMAKMAPKSQSTPEAGNM